MPQVSGESAADQVLILIYALSFGATRMKLPIEVGRFHGKGKYHISLKCIIDFNCPYLIGMNIISQMP